MVGLDDLKGLFQPKCFYDCMILWLLFSFVLLSHFICHSFNSLRRRVFGQPTELWASKEVRAEPGACCKARVWWISDDFN